LIARVPRIEVCHCLPGCLKWHLAIQRPKIIMG
jgi:hypothetical protein